MPENKPEGRKIEIATKLLLMSFASYIFARLFIFSFDLDWPGKFHPFRVPASSYAGWDSRNIQVAAACERLSADSSSHDDCVAKAQPVRGVYPEAVVPAYNYPSIWARVYGQFGDDSERFFRKFWVLNAVLLVGTLFGLCWITNFRLFPLVIFSPVTLLAVEKGNVEGITFACVFFPLLFSSAPLLVGLVLSLGGALKLLPVAALPFVAAMWRERRELVRLAVGAAVCAPLLLPAILELPSIVANTPRGGTFAFGLRVAEFWVGGPTGTALAIAFLLLNGLVAWIVIKRRDWLDGLSTEVALMSENKRVIALVSVSVFLVAFLLNVNWAYRFLYLVPAALVLSAQTNPSARCFVLAVIGALWSRWIFPDFGLGLAAYAIFPLAAALLFSLLNRRTTSSGAV